MLLALTMIVSMIPLSVFAADGDIRVGETGLDSDIDTLDTISWPIKVYDYLNDGLLFEYASAQDSSIYDRDGDAYGGGEIMPGEFHNSGVFLGNDYTVNSSETEIYDYNAYAFWLWSKSGYEADVAQQGVGTAGAFKFLRLQPYKTFTDVPEMVISDFANDAGYYTDLYFAEGETKTSYSKSMLRYAVLIYRTNVSNLELTMGVSDPNGDYKVRNFNLAETTGPDGKKVAYDPADSVYLTMNTTTWNYAIVDMATAGAGQKWNNGKRVSQIILDTNMKTMDQYLDLSHIAYFANELEALRFAERATAFSNNPGEYLPDQKYTDSGTKYKHWNMGNNTAFTMLYASSGGGWSGAGGDNTWPNGYYSYQIGKHTGTGTTATTTNNRRKTAKSKGYPVPDDIFFYSVGEKSSHDMSNYDFGYTLYNTIRTDDSAAVMTAGLLQNGLISITGVDGKTYRVPEYKQSTVEYIALLLKQTLAIGQKDKFGNYNYNFVQGSVSSQFADANGNKRDLATALREALGMTMASGGKGNYTLSSAANGGSYAQTKARQEMLIGPYADVIAAFKKKGLTFTYYDAAFYLMHNLFVTDSYNQLQDDYNYLVLSKATVALDDTDKREAFVFDAGFTTGNGTPDSQSSVKYNEKNGTISLTSAVGKDLITYSGTQKTTRYPFLPVQDPEGDYRVDTYYNTNGTPYFEEDGAFGVADYGATYATRDYNYVLQANAEFVYHYQDDLFFQFQGDDDVYLFVNGELVMDIGAAHSVTAVDFSMNRYVLQAQKELSFLKQNYGYRPDMSEEKFEELLSIAKKDGKALTEEQKKDCRRWHHLNLIDGNTYSIDFYYMERHGWGANMRVATNILMTDPAIDTEKKAYQDGAEINYGGIVEQKTETTGEDDVDPDKLIEYSFSLTNKGETKLYNLTFNDYDIGLTLSPKDGLSFNKDNINGVNITDARGLTLEASDLIVTLDGYEDEAKTRPVHLNIRFDGQNPNEELKRFLRDLTSNDGTEEEDTPDLFAGSGLWRHATVTIRGMYYKLTPEQIADGQFNNTVFTTCNPAVDSDLVLNSADTHQVRLIGDARHIYQWVMHDVHFTREELVKWLDEGNKVQIGTRSFNAGDIKMTTCRKDGTSYDFPDIIVRDYQSMTVNYWKSGTHLFFIKLFRDTNNDGTPDDLNGDRTIDEKNDYRIVPLAVFVTELQDDVVVLDYGLEAELTGKNGIRSNDYLTVPNLETNYSIMGMSAATPSYLNDTSNLNARNYNRISFAPVAETKFVCSDGFYEYTVDSRDDKLYFTPTDFMDEEYDIYIAVTIHEADKVPSAIGTTNGSSGGYTVDITKEVQMYQKITVLPSTVMYYEDDFAGINFADGISANISGTGSRVLQQGVDQNVNYGADQVYQTKDNAQLSGNSMTAIKVTEHGELANFTFTGTGFEIVGRTNAFDSGTFMIHVKDGKQTKDFALVPSFSITEQNNLYNVNGTGIGTYTPANRTIYLDVSGVESGTWKKPYAQYTDVNGELIEAPGVEMVRGRDGRYSITVPYATQYIRFYDCTNQTEELSVSENKGDDLFNGSEWGIYGNGFGQMGVPENERKIYFDNTTSEWKQVYLYAFDENGVLTDSWPGTPMTEDGNGIYSLKISDKVTKVVFSDGCGIEETGNVSLAYDRDVYHMAADRWSSSKSTRTIYLQADSGWYRPYAYYWSEANRNMIVQPGATMSVESNHLFKVEVPTDATGIKFINVLRTMPLITEFSNKDGSACSHMDRTELQTLPADRNNVFNGFKWTFDSREKEWGDRYFYFDNTATGWEKVYVLVLGEEEDYSDSLPGTSMKNNGNHLYSLKLDKNATKVVLSDGGDQLIELTLAADGSNLFDGTRWWGYDANTQQKYRVYTYDNTVTKWENVYAYLYHSANGNATEKIALNDPWPGIAMTDVGGNFYSLWVSDEATDIVFNGVNHNMSGHCNTCGTYVGHAYHLNECPCGHKRLDYYLVGYINETDYGCESDYLNMGQYKFQNGKLTAIFKTDCYVFVKTTGNASYFMTDGYPGSNVTSAYLYNTNSPGLEADKLHVPGGVELTFTLVEHTNDTLMLSYTTSDDDVTDLDKTVYFNNIDDWSEVRAYYWSMTDATMVKWPGYSMMPTDADDTVYKITLPADAEYVIFNDGSGTQTMDLTVPANNMIYNPSGFNKGWSVYNPGKTTLSFDNTSSKWEKVYIYYWSELEKEMVEWPGEEMTAGTDERYTAAIPSNATKVLFNNGDRLQTADLDILKNGDIYVYGQGWASSEDGEPVRTVYFQNTDKWENLHVYYWDEINGRNLAAWPGTSMILRDREADIYKASIPVTATHVIFNNGEGGGKQTLNLELTEEMNLFVYDTVAANGWTVYGEAPETPTFKTIYLINSKNWPAPYAYYWSAANDKMVVWPGERMTFVEGNRYSVNVPLDATHIIFSNNRADQTADLELITGKDQYNLSTESWSDSGVVQEEIKPRSIYYSNANNWSRIYIYYWSDSNDKMVEWPGVEMTVVEGGIYTANIPDSAQYIIFNNGKVGEGNQTGDLTLPTGEANFYSVPATACGSWQTYEPQRVLYFDAGNAGWTNVNAYCWSESGEVARWPGTPMQYVKGTLYKIAVPETAEKVIFNNDAGAQTADLTLTELYDKYSFNTGEWSVHTRTIYFEGSGTGSVRLHYSNDADPKVERVIMTRIKNSIYSCAIPVDSKYVIFEDGLNKVGPIILSDDHDYYTAKGRSVFDPVADYRRVVYFENTRDWSDVYVHYFGQSVNDTVWPGQAMTFVGDGIYMAIIPTGVTGLNFNNGNKGPGNQTDDLTVPDGSNLFTINVNDDEGTWSQYTKSKTDAIHQVPTLRVDDLPLGTYTVEIWGIPTYTPDVDWSNKEAYIETTYLYLDGIRIYRPLGKTNEKYANTENDADFKELRQMILNGKAAVASYKHGKDGVTTYTGNVSWTENRNGTGGDMKTVYIGNQLSGINDYLLLGPNNETYLNGNAQTQAVIFYVKETDAVYHGLQIGARGIDAGLFMGGNSSGVNATLYHGVRMKKPDGSTGYGWRPMDTILSGTEQYYTIDYRDCPYTEQNGVRIYQVALFVRSGMVSFSNVKYVGLDIESETVGDATDLQLHNGTIYVDKEVSGTIGGNKTQETKVKTNLATIACQMEATEWIEDTKRSINLKYPALSFEDEVFYNVFFTVSDLEQEPVEMGLLMFDTLEENGTIYDASAVISGVTTIDGMYVARSLGVQAKDLGKTLYFRVFARLADGSYVYSKAASYSVRQYAKSVLEGNYNTKTKALIAAMLKYGVAAQNYFGGVETVSDLINDKVNSLVCDYSTDLLDRVEKADAAKSGIFAATSTGFLKKAPAVSFDGAFAINYFFTPSTTVQGDMTLYYWDAEAYENAEELTAENATGSMIMTPGAQYTAAITGIAAKDMDSTYYVAVVYRSNGQTYCSGVLPYSLAAYCQSKAAAAGTISDLAKATAVYGYYAKQLFG